MEMSNVEPYGTWICQEQRPLCYFQDRNGLKNLLSICYLAIWFLSLLPPSNLFCMIPVRVTSNTSKL